MASAIAKGMQAGVVSWLRGSGKYFRLSMFRFRVGSSVMVGSSVRNFLRVISVFSRFLRFLRFLLCRGCAMVFVCL
jgi:hypothetical protein